MSEVRTSRDRAPDVVVIGGGIVGVACAAHLAAAGRRVRLFEIEAIAAGASGRNSGVVQHPFDPVFVALHLETLALYRDLEAATDGAFRLPAAPVGLLAVTPDDDAARRLAASLAIQHPQLRPTFLDAAAVRSLEPSIAPGIAACRLDIGYPVAPAAATRAYADRAQALGVEITVGVGARPWIVEGVVRGVQTSSGERVAAPDVVVAAGPWTPSIVDASGHWRPIRPLWGVVVAVALAAPPIHVLEEAEIDIEPGPDKGEPGHAFSLVTAAGASSLGSTFLDDQPDAAATVPSLVERGRRFVPEVGTATLGAARVCARPLSLDGRPLLGRAPGVDGLWIAAGHGPWGISTGPASGRLIADLITGALDAPPPELDPARFGPLAAG
jgi:glycine/D-amino acid oxidase-like deaminating enzyme